jgi:hypothetical protein
MVVVDGVAGEGLVDLLVRRTSDVRLGSLCFAGSTGIRLTSEATAFGSGCIGS